MGKKIISLSSNTLSQTIKVGDIIHNMGYLGTVRSISYISDYRVGIIEFIGTTKTLEVFDVNYILRDEV